MLSSSSRRVVVTLRCANSVVHHGRYGLGRRVRYLSSTWNWSKGSTGAAADNKPPTHLTSPEGGALAPASIDPQIQTQVLDECTKLHSSIMPLNDKVRGFVPFQHVFLLIDNMG